MPFPIGLMAGTATGAGAAASTAGLGGSLASLFGDIGGSSLFSGILGGMFDMFGLSESNDEAKDIMRRQNQFASNEANYARQYGTDAMKMSMDYNTMMSNHAFNQNTLFMNAEQAFNAQQVKDQRKWLEDMRSTQYTTAIGDMKNAGINPMLAYLQGGAGTPSSSAASVSAPRAGAASIGMPGSPSASPGASAQIRPLMGAAQTALQIQRSIAEIRNMNATTGQIQAMTDNLNAKTKTEGFSAKYTEKQAEHMDYVINRTMEEVSKVRSETWTSDALRLLTYTKEQLARGELTIQEASQKIVGIQAKLIENELNVSEIVKGGTYGKIRPLLKDFFDIFNSAGSFGRGYHGP